jgi:2-C-methyl-D-erythritol 4-phosphate cytidylyltransferase
MNAVALVPVTGRDDFVGGNVVADDVVTAVRTRVAGVPLLVHCLRGLLRSDQVVRIVVVRAESEVDSDVAAVLGEFGLTDAVDVMSGTLADVWTTVLAEAPDTDVVLVHDPLRAFAPASLVDRVALAVLETGSVVVPVLPCSDTVKRVDDGDRVLDTPDRAGLRVAQSPVGHPAAMVTSDTLPAGARTVTGDPAARRLAGPVDLAMMGDLVVSAGGAA